MSSSKFFQPKSKRQRVLLNKEERANVELSTSPEIQKEDNAVLVIQENQPSSREEALTIKENVNMEVPNTSKEIEVRNNNDGPVPTERKQEIKSSCEAESSAKKNPFACFAYSSTERLPSNENRPKRWSTFSSNSNNKEREMAPTQKKTKTPFVKMKDLHKEEQVRIAKKWHSLVDPDASLEVKRFQVLVAARLHARCQESSVRKAMKALQDSLQDFSVDTLAEADPQALAQKITNLQFYNAKAQQLVKAAQEIKTRFGGKVPEDEISLLKITGIGNVFADLLAFVNTRAVHQEHAFLNQIDTKDIHEPPTRYQTREV